VVYFIFSFYLLRILIFLGARNLAFLLILLELLSWIFVLLLNEVISIKYLIIQAYFIFGAILGSFWRAFLIVFRLILKVGMPPMHLWFIKVSFWINKFIFIFFRTFHKLFPLILIRLFMCLKLFPLILLFLVSGILLFQVVDFFYVILSSSLIHKNWIVLSIQYSQKLGFLYWVIYCRVFLFLLRRFVFKHINNSSNEQSRFSGLSWIVLAGIPPFSLFWIKAWVVTFVLLWVIRFGWMLLIISVLSMAVYFRSFHIRLSLTKFTKIRTIPFFFSMIVFGRL